MSMLPLHDITVVVPTRNEAHNIRRLLASIPSALAVVVVDASEDETPQVVQAARPDATLIRSNTHIAEARQVGGYAAQTPWLLFTDADVTFAPDYFSLLVPKPSLDAVYGPKLSRDEFVGYYRWFARGQQLADWLRWPAVSGSNLLVRRKTWQAVDGFNLSGTCRDASEFASRVGRYDSLSRFAPELVVYATDHRRLRQGMARKTAHSLLRCALLRADLIPLRWRHHDWGYWRTKPLG